MPLSAGTRLGTYEIELRVGAGGLGEVYRARDTRLDRTVALTVISRDGVAHPKRFEHEARVLSRLGHPRICSLYDVGEKDAAPYLVMEYVEGQTLAARLQEGPLSVEQALRYGGQIAEALDGAHRQGVVHGDLKPANIVLARDGVMLRDFGLSRLTRVGDAGERPRPDVRSDMQALGSVLNEMLPSAPAALDEAVRRCRIEDPDEWWPNARDLAAELQRILEGVRETPAVDGVASPADKRWLVTGLLAAALGAALALGLFVADALR